MVTAQKNALPVFQSKQEGSKSPSKTETRPFNGALNSLSAQVRILRAEVARHSDEIAALKRDVYRIEKKQQSAATSSPSSNLPGNINAILGAIPR